MTAEVADLFLELRAYLREVEAEAGAIPDDRSLLLQRLAGWIRARLEAGEPARLVFICTHNSRRSHLAHVWAETAVRAYGLNGIEGFSGGTEATAFNPRAVAALERAGFRIERHSSGDNPEYAVRFAEDAAPIRCVSKVYDQPPNPTDGFCAVMTCSSADAGCPVVFGADERVAVPYDDPKDWDGTAEEQSAYDDRCRQIAREMVYAIRTVTA